MANIFNDSIEGVKGLIKAIDLLQNELKSTITLNKEVAKSLNFDKIADIKKLEKATNEVNKAEKEQLKINSQKVALEKKLVQLREGELDDVIKLRAELQQENKDRKDQIKQKEGLNSLYQDESKRLNDLRKKYKDLRLETGKNTKETEKLRKEIEELDGALKDVDAEAGQFQRNVGNYPEATGKAKEGISTLSAILIGEFVSSLIESRGVGRELTLVMAKIGTVARTVANGLVELWDNKIAPTLDNWSLKAERLGVSYEIMMAKIDKATTLNSSKLAIIEGKLLDLEKQHSSLTTTIEANNKKIDASKNPLSRKELKKSLDAIKTNLKALEDLSIATAKLGDERARLIVQIERTNNAQERAQSLSDDSTLSFKRQQVALKESLKLREQSLSLQNVLAEKELRFAIEKININSREAKLGDVVNRQNVQRLDFLKDFATADKLQQENVDGLIIALNHLNDIESQGAIFKLESSRQEREIARDKYEQDLDFAIDVFDRQKSINEALIGSDKTTLLEKYRLQQENEKLLESSYKNQIALTESFSIFSLQSQRETEEEIRLGRELTLSETSRIRKQSAKDIQNIGLEELAVLEDEEEIRKRLLDLGLTEEIVQNRTKEIITERKQFVQDLADSQSEINQLAFDEEMNLQLQRREIDQTIAEENTEAKIKDFEETEKFSKKKKEVAIESIQDEREVKLALIELEEDLALQVAVTESEKTRAREEANEKRRQVEKDTIESISDLEKVSLEKSKTLWEEYGESISEIMSQLFDKWKENQEKRIEETEKGIERQEEKEDEQRERAQNGQENTLKFEQEARAQREKALIQEQKRLEQIQKLEAFWNTYNANLNSLKDGQDSGTALAKTLRDIAVIEAISTFEDGGVVEDKLPKDGIFKGNSHKNGGIQIEVEGQEGIFSKKEMANLGKDNFYALKTMAKENRISDLLSAPQVPFNNMDITLRNEINGLKNAINDIEIQKVDVRKFANDIIEVKETVKRGRKTQINRHLISK